MCRIWSMDLAQPRQQGIDIGMLAQQPIDQHPIAAPQWVGEVGCQPVRLVIIVDDAALRLGQAPGFAQPFPLTAQRVGGNAEILDESATSRSTLTSTNSKSHARRMSAIGRRCCASVRASCFMLSPTGWSAA